jgi:transcriptional regulator with XRE-family HTH domain
MDDQRTGELIRRVRLRLGLSQQALAVRARVSQPTVSRVERGHLDELTLATVRAVARAIDVRLDLVPRWRGGDVDRMLNAGHSALHDSVARRFGELPDWRFEPEVSFSIWGERGVVDILAWHAKRRILLVVELKTAIIDVNELVGTFDRKVRLAREIARRHGWTVPADAVVASWVIVTDTRTNRRRVAAHAAMLRAAFPADGRAIDGWLRRPRGPVRCLSFWRPVPPGMGN